MSQSTIGTRLEFNRIDGPAIALLREHAEFLHRELGLALDTFYRHVALQEETRKFFPTPDIMRHAKEMQLRHWKIILAGAFNEEYEQSVRRIGETHHRLGLEPRLYIGGYNFLISETSAGIGLRLPSTWMERDAAQKRVALQSAFIRAALLDMEIAQSVYLDALNEGRRSDLRKVASELDRSIAATISGVTATASQLEKSARTMHESARVSLEQAQAVEKAAATTTANVSAVSAATTQMSQSVNEISQQTRRTHEIAQASAEAAQTSERLIGQLADAAGQIGGILGMINGIAGKTNMLALNATIEAARAGEAGRGFAVVASEVKALAEQTARATSEIGEKIAAIQTSTRLVTENIAAISHTTGETSTAATGIATSVEQQGAATEEISRNISEAAHGVADVARGVQAVSRTAEAANIISSNVLEASQHLTDQAKDLGRAMSAFLGQMNAA